MRLDTYLAQNGLAKSRTRAAELISGGFVTVGGKTVTKPSYDVSDADEIELTGEEHGFVGRGGMKLDGALEAFGIDVSGMICADIGASTGGFTDCLLKRGASKIFAVDSGHGQLDESLLNDERVVNLEGVNARYMTAETLGAQVDLAVADLSFISQTLVLPAVRSILKDGGAVVTLIKPQFECGKSALNKNGIVKDKKQHIFAVRQVLASAAEIGLMPEKIIKSPIKGGDGNTEFLMYAVLGGENKVTDNLIKAAADE